MPLPLQPTVLIVDDDDALARLLEMMLGLSGFDAHMVNSGRAAIHWFKERLPHIVVLDLMMPDIDGLGVLKHLRGEATTRALPVIILTARIDTATHNACREAGANEVLTKPVSREVLVERLRQVLAATAP